LVQPHLEEEGMRGNPREGSVGVTEEGWSNGHSEETGSMGGSGASVLPGEGHKKPGVSICCRQFWGLICAGNLRFPPLKTGKRSSIFCWPFRVLIGDRNARVFGRLPHTRGQGSWPPPPGPFPYACRQSSVLKDHRLYLRSTWLKYFGSSSILLRFCCEVPQYCYANAHGCIFGLGPGIGGKVFLQR
jgi:hypothetical protein